LVAKNHLKVEREGGTEGGTGGRREGERAGGKGGGKGREIGIKKTRWEERMRYPRARFGSS